MVGPEAGRRDDPVGGDLASVGGDQADAVGGAAHGVHPEAGDQGDFAGIDQGAQSAAERAPGGQFVGVFTTERAGG